MDVVTRDELSMYATIGDLVRCEETTQASITTVNTLQQEIGWLKGDYTIALGTPDVCNSGGVGGAVGARLEEMEREIRLIKEALLEVQDTLRQLGLDDMSQRLGDLNLLLT